MWCDVMWFHVMSCHCSNLNVQLARSTCLYVLFFLFQVYDQYFAKFHPPIFHISELINQPFLWCQQILVWTTIIPILYFAKILTVHLLFRFLTGRHQAMHISFLLFESKLLSTPQSLAFIHALFNFVFINFLSLINWLLIVQTEVNPRLLILLFFSFSFLCFFCRLFFSSVFVSFHYFISSIFFFSVRSHWIMPMNSVFCLIISI